MAPDPLSSGFARGTAQARSEYTAQRILDEGLRLFAEGRLHHTKVAEIAAAAGISVGGFYGRFRTKADLERAVAETVLGQVFAPFLEAFAPDKLDGLSAAEIVARYAETLVTTFGREPRAMQRRVVLMVRSDVDLPTSQAIRDLNRRVQEHLAQALLARREQIGHPKPEAAIAFADLAMSAAAREALLHEGTGLTASAPEPAELVQQLTELGCGFLRIPLPRNDP